VWRRVTLAPALLGTFTVNNTLTLAGGTTVMDRTPASVI
jgi:hypothetical protein